ncbi:MAG: S-layer homology domain-containing protein, partial [Clostridia bacterium]|nr:S-layer homology domain-containing protein [Clostridia bacterium]
GSGNIKAVLTLFEDYTGISTAGISDKTYSAISGKQYSGYSELKSAITAAQSSSSSGGSSGGGGGGGGGGGVSTVKTSKSGTGTAYTPSIQSSEIPPQLITFSDIDAYPWAYEAITSLANRGIVSGTGDSEYTPERNVTREEFIKMLNGALGIAEAEYSSIFDDVAADAWYAPYVIAAAQNGICQGIGDREFGSGLELTRQDMACLIYNAVKDKLTAYEDAESFADLPDIANYAVEAVTALHNAGLMNGKDNNIFDPRASATRAETAVVIYSVLNMLK